MRENKPTKMKAPIKLLVSFTDRDVAKDLENYLNDKGLDGGIVFMGKGTSESEIADIFGFGMSDRDVIACLVPTGQLDKVIHDFNEISGIERDNYGLLFVIDLQSASSNLLEFLRIKVGG